MSTTHAGGLVWLRRDLRLAGHAALYDELPRRDRWVEFIRESPAELAGTTRW